MRYFGLKKEIWTSSIGHHFEADQVVDDFGNVVRIAKWSDSFKAVAYFYLERYL